MGEETETFLRVLEKPQKMRSPACSLGRSVFRPDPPPLTDNPMFDPREGGRGASNRRTRPSVSGMGQLPSPTCSDQGTLVLWDASVRSSGNLAKSKWLSLVKVVS